LKGKKQRDKGIKVIVTPLAYSGGEGEDGKGKHQSTVGHRKAGRRAKKRGIGKQGKEGDVPIFQLWKVGLRLGSLVSLPALWGKIKEGEEESE
jgi:hypothetical protein